MILPILYYPDPRLRTKAKAVEVFDGPIKTLVSNMFETMYAEGGIGLAATQVNHHLRVIVMDVPKEEAEYQQLLDQRQDENPTKRKQYSQLTLINPVIEYQSDDKTHSNEGCLSVPDFRSEVERCESIKVKALDEDGKPFTTEASGLLAICIQHEIDHLNGILFVDYISKLKQNRLLEKLKKTKQFA